MHAKNYLLLLIASLLFLNGYTQKTEAYILNENFDRNSLGWVEEFTSAHYTGIKEGFLFIVSKDTSRERTSNGPQNISFLWDLPQEYEISASFYRLNSNRAGFYGIMLNSSSLTYKFAWSDSGMATLTEYDYNSDMEETMVSKKFSRRHILDGEAAEFRIKVSGRNFIFFLNKDIIGKGELKSKSWEGIRLFTSSGSAVKIDYFRIRKI